MSKVSRGDVGENKVANVLKSIKEYHYIFNNVTLKNKKSEMSHQIDHILVNSHGIIVIETKNYYGKINFDEKTKTWTSTVKGKTTQIKSPVSQNKSHAINLNNIFKGQVTITSVVVYANNNAPYIANENVINLEDLKTFLDTYDFPNTYEKFEIDQFAQIIEANKVDISRDEHVENIRLYKMYKAEQETMMKYAQETGKCPMCESTMLKKGRIHYCAKCGYKFKI